MAKRKQLRRMGFYRINNAEYGSFSTGTIRNIDEAGAEALGIELGLVEAYRADNLLLTEIISHSRMSYESELIVRTGARCAEALRYLINRIDNGRRLSPVEADRKGYYMLYTIIAPYRKIPWIPRRQQIAQTTGLLTDLGGELPAGLIARLGLAEDVAALEALNNQLGGLIDERATRQIANRLPDARTVRSRMNELYEEMMTQLFARAVIAPSAEADRFIASQNKLIFEITSRFNIRMGLQRHYRKLAADRAQAEEEAVQPAEE